MTFHVFITTPRAGVGFAVSPYTVEAKEVFATRGEAQAFADAKTLNPGVVALFNAMPSVHPAWQPGTLAVGVPYPVGTYRSHVGKTWVAAIGHTANGDMNWQPGGAANLWTLVEAPGATPWAAGVNFTNTGQYPDPISSIRRGYSGRLYELVQRHRTQADWTPPAVPALWKDVGSALEVPAYTRALWDVVSSDEPGYTEVNRAKEA